MQNVENHQRRYTYNVNIFNTQENIAYYLLGAVITDGCIRKNHKELILTSQDYDWLKEISEILVIGGKPLYKLNHAECFNLSISNCEIINWFTSHGVTPAKSLTAQLPIIPDQFIVDVLRGIIDGDGCIVHRNGRKNSIFNALNIQIVSASKQFADDVSNLLNIIKIKHYITKPANTAKSIRGKSFMPTHQKYIICLGTQSSMKLCNIMYYKNCLCLSRKYNKYICFLHQRKSVISKILNKPVESLTDMDIFRNYGGCKRTQLSHVRE